MAQYYQARLVLTGGRVLEWGADGAVRVAPPQDATQVAVNHAHGLAVDAHGVLLRWSLGGTALQPLLDQVALVAAGDSGLLAIRSDGSLWSLPADGVDWRLEAPAAQHAWVGDGADYFIDGQGALHVRGLAHRGQYGDGRLEAAEGWTAVAADALQVVAHTGHALHLRRDGTVLGTGGNRFGPLGTHGFGDKADRWGPVFGPAASVATGSRHSLAIDADAGLWAWGAGAGLSPQRVMDGVVAVDGGDEDSTVLCADGSAWAFTPGAPPWRLPLPA